MALEENHQEANRARGEFERQALLFRRTVREAYRAGLTPSQIARVAGISRGRVHQILG
jgi:DNA-directed RNA polymerase specialized sigma24 family protein